MEQSSSILVIGSTGKQGGAVARLLLQKGYKVRALTRHPDSPAAKELQRQQADVARGDMNDPETLRQAMRGMDTVFAITTPYEGGIDAEIRQGKILADEVQKARVKHFVFSSVCNSDRNTGIPHFDSKYKIEQYIKSSKLPYTIIRPVFFMENYLSEWWMPGLQQGKLDMALPASRELQHIALADIAGFAVLVMERREQFLGRSIDIASDEITEAQVVNILSRVSGLNIQYREIPLNALASQNQDWAKMFDWFNRVGYNVDINALHSHYPEVGWHKFEDWVKTQNLNSLKPTMQGV